MQPTPAAALHLQRRRCQSGTHTVSIKLQPSQGFVAFGGLGNFTQGAARGLSDQVVVSNQQSFFNLNFTLTPRTPALVQNLYQLVLDRSPAINELNATSSALTPNPSSAAIGQTFANFINSAEFTSLVAPLADALSAFIPNDSSGNPIATNIGLLCNSVQLERNGVSQDAAMLNILYSQQFVNQFGDLSPNNSNETNSTFVTTLYTTLLKRQPSPSEVTSWVNLLNSFTVDRGQVVLAFVQSAEFLQSRQDVIHRVDVSLAYLGILGRQASGQEMSAGVAYLANTQNTVAGLGALYAGSPEYQALPGFTAPLVWDTLADQIEPAVDPLSRLAEYDTATQQFDLTVSAQSITSTAQNPVDLYVLAHGWGPGNTEDVLLGSTPGDPLKAWQVSATIVNRQIPQVNSAILAQSLVDADPNAVVLAYSWIDQSATPTPTVTVTRQGSINVKTPNLLNIANTSGLFIGMSVSGPNIPTSATITAIVNSTQVMLSANATTSSNGASYTFSPATFTQVSLTGQILASNLKQITVASTSGAVTSA